MNILRNLILAGTVAVATALSAGGASAAPAGLGLNTLTTSESAATPVYHYGYQGYGYGRRLCYVPFFKLVQWFGYWQAKRIKARCFGGYNYYSY